MFRTILKLEKYIRATNYLSVAQIYLGQNALLEKELTKADIKSRLLGHWGTCPGINFLYAHLNRLIGDTKADMMFVLGTGHGFPALQANLFMEGTLSKYYPEITQTREGITKMTHDFSWPYGFPSHSSPTAPGVIVEGGELGYALSTSYGAVLDNPHLIVACLVGDGEAETGATATAWHLHRFIDPATNGAVLPVLHLNGYKISGPTIFGRMSDRDLLALFRGYGYDPVIVEGEGKTIHRKMIKTLDQAYASIRKTQKKARENKKAVKEYARFPMIILRTKKGWGGIKTLKGEKIEGNCLSHQVVGTNAKTDDVEFEAVKKWLMSYKFYQLFDGEKGFVKDIKALMPHPSYRMGDTAHAYGMRRARMPDLILPKAEQFMEPVPKPGTIGSSSMQRISFFLNEVFRLNKHARNFRLMSPDETYSNKLTKVFETTARAFAGKIEPWDKDMHRDGRVMEMLSEHSLQGLLQGYVLTGRYGVFASYEAFVQVVASMADQYAKFLRVAREVAWRGDVPSFVYILTSSGWRQEHNGFSHQNPGFISNMLQMQGCFVKVFFPPDGNTALAVLEKSLASKNEIHIIVAGKTLEARWLTPAEIREQLLTGLGIWDFASDAHPDIVFSAAGEYLTKEALASIMILKEALPEVQTRFVNIMEMSALGIGNGACSIPLHEFEYYFTIDKPVIFNFHGYPETLKQVLFNHQNGSDRFSVHGYVENGSTTTPFDLHLRNKTSRFDLAIEAVQTLAGRNVIPRDRASHLVKEWQWKIKVIQDYAKDNGVDPDEIENWTWNLPKK